MDVGLGIAGLMSVLLAGGHEIVGFVAVLPTLTEERLPGTVVGPPSLTVAMLRVTWHLVGLFAFALGGVLITLAVAEDANPRTATLRWVSAMWLAATAVALWTVRHRPRNVLRLPVPLVWPILALLCWQASS
ncbi:MAG: hypothetical protein AB1679_09055 [Actinomycetota bacterium]|jgi:4-amino-4-deoxy-L-arabinose transferase-like glycosyltransferase